MEKGRERERIRTLTADLADCHRQLGAAKSAQALLQQTEKHLKAALREKDLQLRGIHHRVRNNLQIIASLISLQARPGIEPEMQIILDQLQGRVRAIAALHETLYSSPDLGSILFGPYMEQLLRELLALHSVEPARILLRVEAADMVLNMDQALPLGLILTEVITSHLQHAFSQEQQSVISVSLRYVPADTEQLLDDAQVELSVNRKVIGVSAGPEAGSPGSQAMDLHMVEMLVAELDGSLQIAHDDAQSAKLSIRFPLQADELKRGAERSIGAERNGLETCAIDKPVSVA